MLEFKTNDNKTILVYDSYDRHNMLCVYQT